MPPLIVTDSNYRFVPPHEGTVWPRVLSWVTRRVLRSRYHVTDVVIENGEKLTALCRQQEGVLLAPNHCRMSDALVMQELSRELQQPFFVMASSHLFRGSRTMKWILRRMGAFSVYREGVDRQAVDTATNILAEARRPLVIFPEGALSFANERLNALMEGVPFIARTAARKAGRDAGASRQVYVVPVAIRYRFAGDLKATVDPLLREIEDRLTWRPGSTDQLVERIYHIGNGLLGLKETERLGSPQAGSIEDRLRNLIDSILQPLEEEWLERRSDPSVINRVKELRKAVVPAMIESSDRPALAAEETARRWRQLEDMALAQALSLFPPSYLASRPTAERILETVERMAETLTGQEQRHGPMKVIIRVGEPLLVAAKRDRSATADPVMTHVESELNTMLESLSAPSPLYEPRRQP